ncbi:MAG TPA: YtcA family lipoprotein [Acidisarcina sp.]|nr:YtcA family lipoprotein [Acidisarcina sp.]
MAAFAGIGSLIMLSGCGRAPSFNILGSFFPAWLLCIVAGILLAVVVHWLLARVELDKEIEWSIVVYPCLALFFAFTLWLVFFNQGL